MKKQIIYITLITLIATSSFAFGATFIQPRLTPISANIDKSITYTFNGLEKPVPVGYDTIIYEGRTYVSSRYIAESMGAKVEWSPEKRQVQVTYDTWENPNQTGTNTNTGIIGNEETTKPAVTTTPSPVYTYSKLPLAGTTKDLNITVTAKVYTYNEKFPIDGRRVYFELENEGDAPVQLVTADTVILVDGVKHPMRADEARNWDTVWYNDIRKDQIIEGFIRLPESVKKDPENIHIEITIKNNDGTDKKQVLEFNIAL